MVEIWNSVICSSIRTSMQNLESVAQKMAELLHNYMIFVSHFFYFFYNLFGQSTWTSMQNLESVAQKITKLWVLMYCLYFRTFVICSDCPHELPCKIWSLYLKKWPSYCTRYERGHFGREVAVEAEEHIFFSGLYSPNSFLFVR